MDVVLLFVIVALLLFGPRRGGRAPSTLAIAAGAAFLLWLAMAFGLGSIWHAIVGDVAQP